MRAGMTAKAKLAAMARAAFDRMVEQAQGDARKLATLAALAHINGPAERAYGLALEARGLAPDDRDIHSLTDAPFTAAVPKWHFAIVRDEARNSAYEAALKRAVGPESRVLDIGAGTGLLAMMAARAGARTVVTCEMNPAVADAAAAIVALNGYSDRVRVIAKRSTELDVEADMGGRADILVSEIVANDVLRENALPVMEDAVRRLLKPGGRMIPSSGQALAALAYWGGLNERRLGEVAGFDMAPFNRLDRFPRRLSVGSADLALRSAPQVLFDFDFTSGGPYHGRETRLELVAEDGPVNGIVQWIRLQLDEEGVYENRPEPGATSAWAVLFHPLGAEIDPEPGQPVPIAAAHSRHDIRIWSEA
jgi:type II protein arginine methyltransferase